MSNAYIKTDSNTYNIEYERVEEQPIWNVNTVITIGGVVKSQADSERLEITTTIRIPQSGISSLKAVINDFSASLRYKPSRLLWDRTTIEEIAVIIVDSPQIQERVYNGAKYFYLQLRMEEVIET